MKKKVTDLSQALAVGLPVPASAAGETFSDVPAPPWAVPAAPEGKNGGEGCSVRSVSRSTPLKVRIQPDCPPA